MTGVIRLNKGESLRTFPQDYTVVDIETNGFYSDTCEILEISAVKFRQNIKTETFSVLIKNSLPINPFITSLTGITEEMTANGVSIKFALTRFAEFVENDIILGYNVNFDINFLYDNMVRYLNKPLTNNYVDVLYFARKGIKNIENHKQTTVARYFGICIDGAHRAETDCLICNAIYQKLKPVLIRTAE